MAGDRWLRLSRLIERRLQKLSPAGPKDTHSSSLHPPPTPSTPKTPVHLMPPGHHPSNPHPPPTTTTTDALTHSRPPRRPLRLTKILPPNHRPPAPLLRPASLRRAVPHRIPEIRARAVALPVAVRARREHARAEDVGRAGGDAGVAGVC